MAGSNSQKELLSLIRDVSTEKSQGERRVLNLKRQIEELQSELNSVNLELEEAKESTEQELKGYELEFTMNQSSIQTLEGRISLIQDEVSTIGSELEAVKNEEGTLRDDFIGKMFDLNANIRKFQLSVDSANSEAFSSSIVSQDVHIEDANTREVEEAKRGLEDKLAQIISEINKKEQEYQSEQNIHMQEKKKLDDLNNKISLMEAVMEGSNEFQELRKQTSVLEEECFLREKLQKKCICPSCHCNNAEMLGGILQQSS